MLIKLIEMLAGRKAITIDILRRLDLSALACELGSEDRLASVRAKKH
jgi:hypothetical protein